MNADPHPWSHSLPALYQEVWTRLQRGIHDRRAAARHPTLATVCPDGRPRARTVVLRRADKAEGSLSIYTDLRSGKIADLQKTAWAELHVWDSAAHLQFRMTAQARIITGQDVAAVWDRMPDHARLAYGGTPAPGASIDTALDYDKTPSQAAFAVLHLSVESIESLYLGRAHKRALFRRDDDWTGRWLAP